MSCRKFERWIEDEASGTLDPRRGALLAAHAAVCPACRGARTSADALAHDLALLRVAAPEVDVVARVLAAVRAEARARELRTRVGARAFWGSMAASFACVGLLVSQASRAARALTPESIPPPDPLLRIATGFWSMLKAMTTVAITLADGLLNAAVHALRQSPYALPVAEMVTLAILALALLVAALPIARTLWPAHPARRSAGR